MEGIDYSRLQREIQHIQEADFGPYVQAVLQPQLEDAWSARYIQDTPDAEIVAVPLETFTYLFDLTFERNIAASGLIPGRNAARARPRA
jgi:hypothetical protein